LKVFSRICFPQWLQVIILPFLGSGVGCGGGGSVGGSGRFLTRFGLGADISIGPAASSGSWLSASSSGATSVSSMGDTVFLLIKLGQET